MFSISFAYPLMLFLLPLPALLAAWVWRRQSGRVVLPFDHDAPRGGAFMSGLVNLAELLSLLRLRVERIGNRRTKSK